MPESLAARVPPASRVPPARPGIQAKANGQNESTPPGRGRDPPRRCLVGTKISEGDLM
jgi:hypothetical protein